MVQPFELRPPSLSRYPSYLAAQAAKSFARGLTDALDPYGVRPHHLAVLAALADFGPQCQQELCDRLDLDKSHMVSFIGDLEEQGLVERTRDAEDRRKYRVGITADGQTLLGQLLAVEERCHQALLGVLDDRERERLVELLAAVVQAADDQRLTTTPGAGAGA